MKRLKLNILNLFLFAAIMLTPALTRADRRYFVWNYQYITMPEGELEIEHYTTVQANREAKHFKNTLREQMIEFEYGITDHLDISFYQMYRQKPNEGFEYRGYKLRTRYRFGEEDAWIVDPVLYIEWIQKGDEVELEEKIILGKTFGYFISTLNITFEQEYKDRKFEYKLIPSFGIAYEFSPVFSLGIEALNHWKFKQGKQMYSTWFAGPSLSLSGSKIWASLGFLPQITKEYKNQFKYQARLILGISL